jgi:hypothetical protein
VQAIKQTAIATIAKLPDDADIQEIIAALERIEPAPAKQPPPHPVDACFGALGCGRRTDTVMAELRGEP